MREFMNKEWTRKDSKRKSPNILRLISIYNMRSNWVASLVLQAPDTAAARQRLIKLVQTTLELRRLNNFFSASSFMAGLGLTPVHRLRPAWEGLSTRQERSWEDLRTFYQPSKNYGIYRAELRAVQQDKLPHILNLSLLT